jgi:hypothetical protein
MGNTNLVFCILNEVFDYAKKTPATAIWRNLLIYQTVFSEWLKDKGLQYKGLQKLEQD